MLITAHVQNRNVQLLEGACEVKDSKPAARWQGQRSPAGRGRGMETVGKVVWARLVQGKE